ncbi:MAG: DNA-directed RNA polymerase subunit beta', partial [Firmicutes bacterium]|nr:DNA-directed RNA polymerase subunit beta' [Bacillota bacterium]
TQLTMRTFHTGGVAGGGGDGDITQGLPRVEELFEARKPKKMATLAEISGKITIEETKKPAISAVNVIDPESGEVKTYSIPHSTLLVHEGDIVEKGAALSAGALYPRDVMRIRGTEACQNYIIQEIQRVYRQQGVDINDKHIEVIVRQMMRKVEVQDSGDTDLLSGSTIDITEFKEANRAIRARNAAGERNAMGEELREATCERLLMGITKASLATESWMSAASFQETTKVLTDAAIKGKVDHLTGLKENVIIGKLIPAGSGLNMYRDFEFEKDESVSGDAEYVDLSALMSRNNAL